MNTLRSIYCQIIVGIVMTSSLGAAMIVSPLKGHAQNEVADALQPGQQITPGSSIRSSNGKLSLVMQADGNLVLYEAPGKALWATNTSGLGANRAIMQLDGNFVVYKDSKPVWATGTNFSSRRVPRRVPLSHPKLVMQNDGNLVLYHENRPVWSSRTNLRVLETMTDRCSGDVFIELRPGDGLLLLDADRAKLPKPASLTISGHTWIRWWCHSTTGNLFDPGTWRIKDYSIMVNCTYDPYTGEDSCSPDVGATFSSSAVNGWTPERSRCKSERTRFIDARLGSDRLLRIRCWGR